LRGHLSCGSQREIVCVIGGRVREARVATTRVVEREVAAEAGPDLGRGVVRVQEYPVVPDSAPVPVNEDVVAPAALPIHADPDPVRCEKSGQLDAL